MVKLSRRTRRVSLRQVKDLRGQGRQRPAALRQNAPKPALWKFPSSRHAGNEIDRKVLRCKLLFRFWLFCIMPPLPI
jgi:hypothetical protein